MVKNSFVCRSLKLKNTLAFYLVVIMPLVFVTLSSSFGCCLKKSHEMLDDSDVQGLVELISLHRAKAKSDFYTKFRQRLLKLADFVPDEHGATLALRVYMDEPGHPSRAITIYEMPGRVNVEIRKHKLESDVLFSSIRNGFKDASSLIGTSVTICRFSKPSGSLENLIEANDLTDMPSSKDIEGRRLIVDGTYYYFELLHSGKLYTFSFDNPETGVSGYDNRITRALDVIKSWY